MSNREVRRIAVIGAGTMGHGIAQVAAVAGYDVDLIDAATALAHRGFERVRANLDDGIRRQKLSIAERDAVLGRIRTGAEMARCSDADIVIEAVPEKIEVKAAVFDQVEPHIHSGAILATNTSSLSVTELQQRTAHAERFIGLHFFNPVHINKLVEVVRGRHTSDDTVTSCLSFIACIGKDPIIVNDAPGFATSRLGVLLGLEAMRMLEEGVASAADIDKAMELGYRHPMGPLKLTDLVGLDVRLDIARYLHEKLRMEQFRPPRILEQLVEEGKLGKKTGQGFYTWEA